MMAGKSLSLLLQMYKTFNFLQHSIPSNEISMEYDRIIPNSVRLDARYTSEYRSVYQYYCKKAIILEVFLQRLLILQSF